MSNSKKKMESEAKALEKAAKKLMGLIGVDVELEIEHDKDNDAYRINIKTEEQAGLLIGNRGRTLLSMQYLLAIILKNEIGEWKRVLLDVAGWRDKEESRLKDLAMQSADRAKETGQEQSLYNLNSQQRRVIHLELSNDKDVETESQGEGKDRFIIVRKKSSSKK